MKGENVMKTTVKVAKWGNGLAVRLPAAAVDALDLQAGDDIEIHLGGDRRTHVTGKLGRDELIGRLRNFRGRIPADFKFDRNAANGR